jgi:hypothetical protein
MLQISPRSNLNSFFYQVQLQFRHGEKEIQIATKLAMYESAIWLDPTAGVKLHFVAEQNVHLSTFYYPFFTYKVIDEMPIK